MERWGGEGMLSTCTDGVDGDERIPRTEEEADLTWGEGGKPDWEGRIIMD